MSKMPPRAFRLFSNFQFIFEIVKPLAKLYKGSILEAFDIEGIWTDKSSSFTYSNFKKQSDFNKEFFLITGGSKSVI